MKGKYHYISTGVHILYITTYIQPEYILLGMERIWQDHFIPEEKRIKSVYAYREGPVDNGEFHE